MCCTNYIYKRKTASTLTRNMCIIFWESLFVLPMIANFELFGVLFEVKRLNYSDEEKSSRVSEE